MKFYTRIIALAAAVSAVLQFPGNIRYKDTGYSYADDLSGKVFSAEDSTEFITPDFMSAVYAPEKAEVPEPVTSDFPETFDLRDYGLMTSVKTQGHYGTCWAISAMQSLEADIMKKGYDEDPDLSEWHLSYFSFIGDDVFHSSEDNVFLSGGTNTVAAAILSRWIGAAEESDAPYGESMILDKSLKYECDYQVQDVENIHSWTESHVKYPVEYLKEMVYDQKAVSVFYNSSSDYYNENTHAVCCLDPEDCAPNHAVTLAGWDDNYPKENFPEGNIPENDGAWLVKNSWGEDWGDDGYFWLSYEDLSFCEGAVYSCVPGGTYSKEYSYDDLGWVSSICADPKQLSSEAYMSNVFTADTDDNISAVGFYTTENNAEYEISVYTDLKDPSDPVSGKATSVVSGSQKYSGYHTVRLEQAASVKKGSSFSVVIKIKNPTSPYSIATETSILNLRRNFISVTKSYIYVPTGSEAKQSYISIDGKTWADIASKQFTYKYPEKAGLNSKLSNLAYLTLGNLCIKAFAEEPQTEISRFDINRDGAVDSADYLIIHSYFLGLEMPEKYSSEVLFDLNDDGSVNISDIIAMKAELL